AHRHPQMPRPPRRPRAGDAAACLSREACVLWACLRFPQLALDLVHAGTDETVRRRPFALVVGSAQRRHVLLANAPARKAGVQAGKPLAGAQLLCPRLAIAPRDEAAERQALETLAALAYRYSAEVSLAAPDTLFVEAG